MQSTHYLPSLSTGIYGLYIIQHDEKTDDPDSTEVIVQNMFFQPIVESKEDLDQKNDDNEQFRMEMRDQSLVEHDDTEVPIKPLYYAAQEIDNKYQLIFKPECNFKGCCNKPQISEKLLKGDMYICKKHRIQMAAQMKQSCSDNQYLKQAVLKLQTYDDKHFHHEGMQLENTDYFLQNFAKIQQLKFKVAKQLSKIKKRMSPEYWECVAHYKQLQEAAKLLLSIRKISNPMFTILFVACILKLFGVIDTCGKDRYNSQNAEETRKRRQREKERQKKIKECQDAFTELNEQYFQNAKLKTKCIKRIKEIDGEIKQIEANYQKEIKPILAEMNAKAKEVENLDSEIEAIEKEAETASIDKILELEEKLEIAREKRHNRQIEMKNKEMELKEKQIEFEKSEAAKRKAALEMERQRKKEEQRRREREEDELNWKKAYNRAEYGSRNTSAGKVSCYVVYDKRCFFSSGYENTYGIYRDEKWDWYGNWYICKFEADRMSHKTLGYTTFKYRTSDRNTYWVARYNGTGAGNSGKNGDLTTICC